MPKRWDKKLRTYVENHDLGMVDVTYRSPIQDNNWFESGITGPINEGQIKRLRKLLREFDTEREAFPKMEE